MECRRCGTCCKEPIIEVCYGDIIRWKEENRKDVLQEISFLDNYPERGYGGFYIEKSVRKPKQPCPFYIDNLCSIYGTRPMACRDYPYSQSKEKSLCVNISPVDKFFRDMLKKRQQKAFNKSIARYPELMAILVESRR